MDPLLRGRLTAFFDAVPEVIAVYVFGSEGRDDARQTSDVDVAVLFDQTPPSTLMGSTLSLEGKLEASLRRRVDLVSLNTASPDLVHRVLRDGDLVVDRDPSRRISFEVARRNEYFDLQPIRDTYRRMTRRASVTVP